VSRRRRQAIGDWLIFLALIVWIAAAVFAFGLSLLWALTG
jgi:DNA-binding transcriptional regulator of glucitol operon